MKQSLVAGGARRAPTSFSALAVACTLLPAATAAAQSWVETASIAAPDAPGLGDFGGSAVAVSGREVLVGARRGIEADVPVGAAYVFSGDRNENGVRLTFNTPERADEFGSSVSLDGDTALIGGYRLSGGKAFFLSRSGGTWQEVLRVHSADPQYLRDDAAFGFRVAVRGDLALVTAPKERRDWGRLYTYARVNGIWKETAPLYADDVYDSDFMGWSLDFDGKTAVIGAPGNRVYPTERAAAYVFVHQDGEWHQQARLSGDGISPALYFGESVAVDGNTIAVGAIMGYQHSTKGKVFIFTRQGAVWTQAQVISEDDEETFGAQVRLVNDVLLATVRTGAKHRVLEYRRSGGVFSATDVIELSNLPDDASLSLAVSGGTLVVGTGKPETGVLVYRNDGLDRDMDSDEGQSPDPASDGGVAPGQRDAGSVTDGSGEPSTGNSDDEGGEAVTARKSQGGCVVTHDTAHDAAERRGSWLALAVALLFGRRRRRLSHAEI